MIRNCASFSDVFTVLQQPDLGLELQSEYFSRAECWEGKTKPELEITKSADGATHKRESPF